MGHCRATIVVMKITAYIANTIATAIAMRRVSSSHTTTTTTTTTTTEPPRHGMESLPFSLLLPYQTTTSLATMHLHAFFSTVTSAVPGLAKQKNLAQFHKDPLDPLFQHRITKDNSDVPGIPTNLTSKQPTEMR